MQKEAKGGKHAKNEEKEGKTGWQSTENARQQFEEPSLKQENPGSISVERLSSEKVQPIEASKLAKRRKKKIIAFFQSCCSDEVCGWKPLAVTSPHRVMSHKGEGKSSIGCHESRPGNARLDGPKETLNPLIAKEPQGINAIGEKEWVEIEVAIDSGHRNGYVGKDLCRHHRNNRRAGNGERSDV